MAGVNEAIVREYFESIGFLVRQFRKYVAPAGREDDDIDFLVLNPQPHPAPSERPFLLKSADLAGVQRGVVIVKAWHSDVFTPALLNNTPDFFRFLEKKTFHQTLAGFTGTGTSLKILAVPALPREREAREQSIAILRAKGLDAAISFRTMLSDLVNRVEPNRNYQKSDLLQLIRVLKNYDLLKEPQMDLFKARPKRGPARRSANKAVPSAE